MRHVSEDTITEAPNWANGRFAWKFFEPCAGDVVRHPYPFTKMDGPCWSDLDKGAQVRWRAGVWDTRFVQPDNFQPVAHGMGEVIMTVVHVAKLPKPYPRRVFYTRQFITPEGMEYKKSGLIIHGINKFRKVCAPFSMGGYVIDETRPPLPDGT